MENNGLIWSTLVHLGSNMWNEQGNLRGRGEERSNRDASPFLRFEENVWNTYMDELADAGNNTVVIDIGEALFYETHPEIAVVGSWKRDRMYAEIERLKARGFDIIPKLNFSTCHDNWLGEYSRMVSTSIYYKVCADLIAEVCEIFKPKYFHIGMDEENHPNLRLRDMAVIRQFDLWWHDLYFLVKCVEKGGARAMMWSDYARTKPEEFVAKCPKSVVQNVWYYGNQFEGELNEETLCRIRPIELFEKHGFDQIPAGSSFSFKENFEMLVKYSAQIISKNHLLGFMQTVWERPAANWKPKLDAGTEALKNAKAWYTETHPEEI